MNAPEPRDPPAPRSDLDRLCALLQHPGARAIDDDIDDGLCCAALDAVGVPGSARGAVRAAGGTRAVLAHDDVVRAFQPVARRRRPLPWHHLDHLKPWLSRGGRVVAGDDDLARFAACPLLCLYGCGVALPARGRVVVAVVGSREATPRWLARTERLARSLARQGAVIVSGGAKGVDREAERAARQQGGDVVVVAGGAASDPARVLGRDPGVCWLSPWGPWVSTGKGMFAARNDHIAACADVVVTVCGAATSGTRYTVAAARRFGRPVAALRPDDDDDPLAAIARGADALVDDDVPLAELLAIAPRAQLELPVAKTPRVTTTTTTATTTTPLLRLLLAGEHSVDDLAVALGVTPQELSVELTLLELSGVVQRVGPSIRLRS